MSATSAPNIEQVAPGLVTRVRAGDLASATTKSFGVGAIALIASLVGWFTDSQQFYYSYLVAYMFLLSLVLGSMFFVLVQHITRAGWSVVVRRVAENMMGVMPWMPVLFLPVAIGSGTIFHHWWHAVIVDGQPGYDELVYHKSAYLNPVFFYVRAALYFGVWIGIARYFRNGSLEQDRTGDPGVTLRLARRAAPGLLLFAMTITFAAFDWIMSIDPHWFSTIFGVTYFAGSVMAMYATLALVCLWLRRRGYLGDVVTAEHYHDIGKLMFAFMVFWTYVNFSQYMLIYYANLPEETMWYQDRLQGNWATVGTLLIVGHFLAPFAFLMSRHMKRNRVALTAAAVFLLVMHWIDMQFLIMPSSGTAHAHHGLHVSWLDVTTMLGLLAVFAGLTLRNSAGVPLVPERDPRLAESLKFQNI